MKSPPLFPAALAFSLGLHTGAALWLGAPEDASAIEIDLTRPISAGPGREAASSGASAPDTSPPAPEPLAASPFGSGRLPTDSGSGTSSLESSVGERPPFENGGPGAAEGPDLDSVAGGAPGRGGWSVPVRPPVLLHPDKVRARLRRLYPEEERKAGREGEVLADLRVDAEGRVLSYEIVRSAGAAFDEAAGEALAAMRFSPALTGTRPVAVKVRQRIAFRLD